MLKDEIKWILRKLICGFPKSECKWCERRGQKKDCDKIITQALTKILELVKKCVPEEYTNEELTRVKIQDGILYAKMLIKNQALAEIKDKLK